MPAPLDSGTACRRQIIKPQKLSSRVIEGLERIAHGLGSEIAFHMSQGLSIAQISRVTGINYDRVWKESKRLILMAKAVHVEHFQAPENDSGCILELFAEAQVVVPDHMRR